MQVASFPAPDEADLEARRNFGLRDLVDDGLQLPDLHGVLHPRSQGILPLRRTLSFRQLRLDDALHSSDASHPRLLLAMLLSKTAVIIQRLQ